jgi:predicted nucleic acid-binding protein
VIWLLDTDTIIHALNGVPRVRDRLNAVPESDQFVTSRVVVAELIYGVECSARREENRQNIRQKLQQIDVFP